MADLEPEKTTCFAFRCTDAGLLSAALQPFGEALQFEPGATQGWGLGYYQAGQPLLRRHPARADAVLDFVEETRQLRSRLILGFRQETAGDQWRVEDRQPYRFRRWLFCQRGGFDDAELLTLQGAEEPVQEHIRRSVRGSGGAARLFRLFLSAANDRGILNSREYESKAVAMALHEATNTFAELVARLPRQQPASCCILSDGRHLIGLPLGMPLYVRRQSSYESCGTSSGREHLRGAILLSAGASPAGPGWESVKDSSLVVIDEALNIEFHLPEPSAERR